MQQDGKVTSQITLCAAVFTQLLNAHIACSVRAADKMLFLAAVQSGACAECSY